jgi:hypothetical protein
MKIYPSAWLRSFEEHKPNIDSGNFVLYNPDDERNKKRTLAVVFKVSNTDSDKISDILNKTIPAIEKEKLLFQPRQGRHFTIQWAPEEFLSQINLAEFLPNIKNILSKFPPIRGSLHLPFSGNFGLYGILKTKSNDEMSIIRKEINLLWKEIGLPTGQSSKKSYDSAYTSLVRYLQPFNQNDYKKLKKIPIEIIPNITLVEVWIVLNDKFMTPKKTQILDKIVISG